MSTENRIVVAGGGVFGTSIAERLAWNTDNQVVIHSIEKDVVATINAQHRNVKYFPTRFLNRAITATDDYEVFRDAECIFLVIPSKAIVSFSEEVRRHVGDRQPLMVNLAKGMSDDGAFITEKIPFAHTASMKGPSFAIEVLNGIPTAFTFGGEAHLLNLGETVVYAASSALGFGVAMILFAGIREQMELVGVPKAFKGTPIALITAGILAMAFMGFSGLV